MQDCSIVQPKGSRIAALRNRGDAGSQHSGFEELRNWRAAGSNGSGIKTGRISLAYCGLKKTLIKNWFLLRDLPETGV